ncbi:MAG: homoserine kinase [Edaphobacter sp.]|uniref:homoserine kinase n=1 Tax=Edaphobacter sp. TaxID=1934404 RepID=UPI0023A34006|nr:homoserine kinase [Edaphobacter sp.]MDE1175080.1 homoserine kinase [Edaphobacter sp.]
MSTAVSSPGPVRLRLPATSANLGPGFDSLGLAMSLYLTIEARVSETGAFSIDATGRNAEMCSQVENNLILTTYMDVLANAGKIAPRLSLQLDNEIPLGMGCGSSAAALVAGVMLANHFGEMGWTPEQVLAEACRREGHPDNVAACLLGGMTVSGMHQGRVITATYIDNIDWKLMVAMPSSSLSTSKARALLPENYSKADAVANVQATALLVSAFALKRGDLLSAAMQDRIHQPYRMQACPLLPMLLPLAGSWGVLGVALSGAGPSVLVIAEANEDSSALRARIRSAASAPELEVVETKVSSGADSISIVIT